MKPEADPRLEAYISATTARPESSTGNDVYVDASGAESKPSTGNMYVAAYARYIPETHYDDALMPGLELSTGKTL